VQWRDRPGTGGIPGGTADATHFEQAFSEDGGKTWEVDSSADATRVR
jgi:hypothetical protein